jgi:transglutaminase-like putative cysteine protease
MVWVQLMRSVDQIYLTPTPIIDSDHPAILAFAEETTGPSCTDPVETAVKLYHAVRDGIWYDPYSPFYLPEHYRASNILKNRRGFCISKASLLCALGRAKKIPSRVGFATVRNHLATKQLLDMLGTDLFVYHGYTEFFLEAKWVKATPAFNIELCERHRVRPLEFNGREDSVFHPYNLDQQQFMEYVADHGAFADIPVDVILLEWRNTYGKDRVEQWIDALEASEGRTYRNFYKEDVVSP